MHLISSMIQIEERENEREDGGREGKRESFHPLVYSSDALNRYVWAWVDPGDRHSIHISHAGDRDPNIWAITCCFPRNTGWKLDQSSHGWVSNPAREYGMWPLKCPLHMLCPSAHPSPVCSQQELELEALGFQVAVTLVHDPVQPRLSQSMEIQGLMLVCLFFAEWWDWTCSIYLWKVLRIDSKDLSSDRYRRSL